MNRLYSFLFVILFLSLVFVRTVHAESIYVLPYPSAMPGNIIYKINLVKDAVSRYWYFGDFGRFSYNLKSADKYLVEAKTLFDYKQYLLGYNALLKSDSYFKNAWPSLANASQKGRDIGQKELILEQAALKHIEELNKMKKIIPKEFYWQPEKKAGTALPLWKAIDNSIKTREEVL